MIDTKPGDLLISRGRWFPNHVTIVVPVFNELVVYEYTMAARPPCVRTNRTDPVGVQVHRLSDWTEAVKNPAIVAVRRRLYYEEVDDLLKIADFVLHSASLSSFEESGDANHAHLPANFVAYLLQQTGIFEAPARRWSPRRLINALIRAGIYDFPKDID